MAIIRNAANTLMKGRVGQTTYYISKGQQVARQSRNDSNYGETARRTDLQQKRRVLWANLVQFYKISARWMPKAFESKKAGQTDYNKFMAVNVPSARIPLTKAEAEAGACVVDGFLVSQGSLPSVEVSKVGTNWKSNLHIGDLTIGDSTTIAQLTEALLANNANIRENMQLSFVMYQQSIDPLGTPRVTCRCYELTLNTESSELVRDHIPAFGLTSVDGSIGTSSDVPTGAFAWILSELQGGALKVTTQLLISNNNIVLDSYVTERQLRLAAESYGIDTEVILNPDNTVQQSLEPLQPSILSIVVNGVTYPANSYYGPVHTLKANNMYINLSGTDELSVSTAKIYKIPQGSSTGTAVNGTIVSAAANPAIVSFSGLASDDASILSYVEVTMSDGTVLTIPFVLEDEGGDLG